MSPFNLFCNQVLPYFYFILFGHAVIIIESFTIHTQTKKKERDCGYVASLISCHRRYHCQLIVFASWHSAFDSPNEWLFELKCVIRFSDLIIDSNRGHFRSKATFFASLRAIVHCTPGCSMLLPIQCCIFFSGRSLLFLSVTGFRYLMEGFLIRNRPRNHKYIEVSHRKIRLRTIREICRANPFHQYAVWLVQVDTD